MAPIIKVAIVDDHALFRAGVSRLLQDSKFLLLFEAENGLDLMVKLDTENLPDVILMDIGMPGKDGFQSTLWVKENFPSIRVLGLTIREDEESASRMIRNGARGCVTKFLDPALLKRAIHAVYFDGFYKSDPVVPGLFDKFFDDKKALARILRRFKD